MRKDFEQGKVGSMRMLGYRRTKSGKLEIVPEEAEIVRMIFLYYLSGMGKLAIAKKLNEQQICTVRGCAWTTEDVRRTLRNEKYTGNLLLQKSFRENHITKKKVANIGQLPQYFVAGSHEAIISQEQFDADAETKWRNGRKNMRFLYHKPISIYAKNTVCLLRQILPQKNDSDRCGLDLFHLQHQREKILSNSKTDSGKYAALCLL